MNKTELINKCNELKEKYMWKELPEEDMCWLVSDVLRFHKDWYTYFAPKCDGMPLSIKPKRNDDKFKTKCFYLIYPDRTEESIGLNKINWKNAVANQNGEFVQKI